MTRLLTPEEIEDMLEFIQPQEHVPLATAESVVNLHKERFRAQLVTQMVYPAIIPVLTEGIKKSYYDSLIQAGESIGVICAQSIGEKQTQTTLNSIDWEETLLYTHDGQCVIQPIGQMIDQLLQENRSGITNIPENRTEYLPLPPGYMISSCDEAGLVDWYRIEAVTKHLPVGQLVKIYTQSGRSVTATQAKSFLVWDGDVFQAVLGADIKVGDVVPTTINLKRPQVRQNFLDMETLFPKDEYLYTTELVKAREYKAQGKSGWWSKRIGIDYVLPYKRSDTCFGRREEYFLTCPPGLVYIHTSNLFVSHIPDKIPLDNDFGFLIGIYLADGWCTKTFCGVSNHDPVIRKRVTDFCDRYGVTYHLVISNGKNVRNGESHDLKIHSTLLAHMFKLICDTGSSCKRIPEFAYLAPDEFIMGLLDGYFSGDGTVNKNDGSIIASSASNELITGISSLLSYFGIFGRISKSQTKHNNVGSQNIKLSHILRISNGWAQKFAECIQLTHGPKQQRLVEITAQKKYMYYRGRSQEKFPDDRDVFFDKVVSVEYVTGTTEWVYDLTVEYTRNFSLFSGLNCRDTFHRAGQSEKTMTAGVPRFQELLNATKKPNIVNHKIYFTEGVDTIEDIRATVGHSIVGLNFSDISLDISIKLDKVRESWYNAYSILYTDKWESYSHCISIKLNMTKLFEFKLTMEDISTYIHKEFDDLCCVFSPPQYGQFDVWVDTTTLDLPAERVLFVDTENAIEIYLEECVQPILEGLNICGIQGISEVFYSKSGSEWLVETNGINSRTIGAQYINYKNLLASKHVDYTRTISNNVWDIYEVLGIEAVRAFLVEEFMAIMEGINSCHAELLVDRMTHAGSIASITRYTMKKDESGPFGRASFEETMDNFLNAAARGEVEPTKGVSAAIICGKRAAIGTGMMDLRLDLDNLPM